MGKVARLVIWIQKLLEPSPIARRYEIQYNLVSEAATAFNYHGLLSTYTLHISNDWLERSEKR